MFEISIVVPVYNEYQNIKPFLKRTESVLEIINKPYEIIFALDPSSDNTEQVILEEIKRNKNIRLLVFSRRFGQPAATIAGIIHSRSSYCVVIDVDLQDPPEIIEQFYIKAKDQTWWRVRVGHFNEKSKAEEVTKTLSKITGHDLWIDYID